MKNKIQKRKGTQAGFISMIIIIIGALVLLKYVYDIDVVNSLIKGNFKDLANQLYELIINWWKEYGDAAIKIWNNCLDFIKEKIS